LPICPSDDYKVLWIKSKKDSPCVGDQNKVAGIVIKRVVKVHRERARKGELAKAAATKESLGP